LILHVRFLAWLNTAPKRMEDDKADAPQLTRLEYMRKSWEPEWINDDWVTQEFYDEQAAVYMPELPPVDDGVAHLVGVLMEIGPVLPAGMSVGPVTFREIEAFCSFPGAPRLSFHEARLIHRMSAAYLSESTKATEHFYPPPWWPEGKERPKTKEQAEQELARERRHGKREVS